MKISIAINQEKKSSQHIIASQGYAKSTEKRNAPGCSYDNAAVHML